MTQSSYITGANNIFLILGWDKTMPLEPVTSNRPRIHIVDDIWMNMNMDVMASDWNQSVTRKQVFSIFFHLKLETYSLSKMLPSFLNGKSTEPLPSIHAKSSPCLPKGFTCLYEAIILTFCSTNYFLNFNSLAQINFPNELESSVFKQQPISGRSLQKTNINIVR